MNRTLAFLSRRHLYLGIVRYLLAMGMFPYAITKILRTQLVLSGFAWAQSQSLESMPGTTLAWAFLGHSAWFQILLGLLELIPALLLFFRRTTLLGATLMLPVTLNVFLINFALELWRGTQVISGVFLVLNILILIIEWKKVKSLLLMLIGNGLRFRFTGIELAINLLLIAGVGYMASRPLLAYRKESNRLTGDWLNQRPVEWVLESEQIGDSILTSRRLNIYFGAYGMYNQSGDNAERSHIKYSTDTLKHTITFKYSDSTEMNCKYEFVGDEGLRIARLVKQSGDTSVVQYFRKRIINAGRDTK